MEYLIALGATIVILMIYGLVMKKNRDCPQCQTAMHNECAYGFWHCPACGYSESENDDVS